MAYIEYDDLRNMKVVELNGMVFPTEQFLFKYDEDLEEDRILEATKMVFKALYGIDEKALDRMFEDEDLAENLMDYVDNNCGVLFQSILKELFREDAEQVYNERK
jgi:hypothetical protein